MQNCTRHGQVPKYCSEVNKDLRQQRRENVLECYLNYNQYSSMREVADALDTSHKNVQNDLEWVGNNRNSADISHLLQYEDVADLNSDENPDWLRWGTKKWINAARSVRVNEDG